MAQDKEWIILATISWEDKKKLVDKVYTLKSFVF